jgi:aryl-alcohol dehydrogenase-like predicted oxidoreductase
MEYRRLGKSGLKVSELCLGTMMFGDRTDEATAKRIADSAADAGVNFIDTADSYAKSVSEQITGKVIAAKRDRWILATKVYNRMGSEPNDSGLGRRWLMMKSTRA